MAQFLDLTGLTRYKNKSDALYAKQDGSYEGMTVGNAEQLVSTVGVSDNAPYTFRTTGGSADVGDRMNLKAVIGGTVAWNQINMFPNTTEVNGITFTKNSDGSYTVTGEATSTATLTLVGTSDIPPVGHKVLLSRTSTGDKVTVQTNGTNLARSYIHAVVGNDYFRLRVGNGATVNETITVSIFDLTAIFGSTIADYLYTLESGAGIAWLKKYGFFTKPYYPYAAANLQSVKTSAHKTYGFNAYNPSTGKAKVVGGKVYQITGAYTALSLDGTSITPDASGYFTPSANGELTVTGGNGTTTCVHLKWDGERDGEWEEFSEHTYALDDVELRGIPKKDANNNLYYDGDKYAPDGTVTRKYGIVDLGSLTWTKSTGEFRSDALAQIPRKPTSQSGSAASWCRCAEYAILPSSFSGGTGVHQGYTGISINTDGRIWGRNDDFDNTSSSQYKTLMSGVYLVYELATPTTESADAYTELQVCDDFGTEEFVDAATRDFDMPCGSLSIYRPNLRAKLEMSPNSPEGDGDYLVRQTNGVNEYVLFSEVKELPDYPTTDGTYVLKCTVADGTATLSWVSE